MADRLPIPHNGKSIAINALMSFDRWVSWRYVEKTNGKIDKPPFRVREPDTHANVSDPRSWASFEDAIGHAQVTGDGVGLVLSPGKDDFNLVAFDLDDCRNPETGELAAWAIALVGEADSYTEITPSRKGLRILGYGNGEELHTVLQRPDGGHIEIYSRAKRYITVSGQRLEGTPDELRDLTGLVRRHKVEREERDRPKHPEDRQLPKTPTPIEKLHRDLKALVERGVDQTGQRIPEGERSEEFHHAVGWLKDSGYSVNDICRYMDQHSTGIAKKYDGRLEGEVRRCFEKCETKGAQLPDQHEGVKLYGIGELLDRKPPEFLIEEMLPEKGVAIIAGLSGSMKTFLMIYLGLMVATGRSVGERKVKHAGVVFLNNEGQAGFGQRCQAALTHHNLEIPENFHAADVAPNLTQEHTLAPFFEAVDKLEMTPGLIVIDTFSKASIGGNDNDTSEMAQAIQCAHALAERFDALVVLIDHVGKDVKKGLRGAYSKHANADMVGMVSRSGDLVTLKTVKQKEAEDDIRFDFGFNLVSVTDQSTKIERDVPAIYFRTDPAFPAQKDFIVCMLDHRGPTEREALASGFTEMYGLDKRRSFNTQFNRLRKADKIEVKDGCVQLVE